MSWKLELVSPLSLPPLSPVSPSLLPAPGCGWLRLASLATRGEEISCGGLEKGALGVVTGSATTDSPNLHDTSQPLVVTCGDERAIAISIHPPPPPPPPAVHCVFRLVSLSGLPGQNVSKATTFRHPASL